jgi:succinate dehydrogenase / fumarate reductase cytochrome b subunit
MSATALGVKDDRAARFYDSTVGKKAVMAVSGVVLFGFIIGHLIGNLQFFLGPESLNAYGRFLHEKPGLTWAVRVLLLIVIALHIWTTIQLALRKREARPIGYVRKKAVGSSYASRTMYWSGPIIAAFVIYHLLDFTFGVANPNFRSGDIYSNIVASFSVPAISIVYVIAMLLLGMHLYHGIWSMFQSLGLHHPRYTPPLKRFAALCAILITAGFISIPISVLAGIAR